MLFPEISTVPFLVLSTLVLLVSVIASQILYNLYLHPLASFHGPRLAAATSFYNAFFSVITKREQQWFQSLVAQYGSDSPIRVAPSVLLCPKPSALKEIYCDPKLNTKGSPYYCSGALGPQNIFTTLPGDEHRALRKALGGTQWSIGSVRNTWEARVDEHLSLFISRITSKAEAGETVSLGDVLPQFAADVMSMVVFNAPWGFVANDRDERGLLTAWHAGCVPFGLAVRWDFYRDWILTAPIIGKWLLPSASHDSGMGWMMAQADRETTKREADMQSEDFVRSPDYLQHIIEGKLGDQSLTPGQVRANATLLIQAGADTTGTALSSCLRFILTSPEALSRCRAELSAHSHLLSHTISHSETTAHLPFIKACIKEGLRLNPPAPNQFSRQTPAYPISINGHLIPPGQLVTTNSTIVQRDPELFGPDPHSFRPDRWLESTERSAELEGGMVVFGLGARICLGMEVAYLEMYKVIPELIRRFDFEVLNEGTHVVVGGVAWNEGFIARPKVLA